MNLAFLASHNGTSAQAITDGCFNGELNASPTLLISNNKQAKALEWAENKGLKTYILNKDTYPSPIELDNKMADMMRDNRISLIILSGYMQLIGPETLQAVDGRIINIHPSLLPQYGGKGMYGHHIHKAVKDNEETQTGITIHQVSTKYDEGKILTQKTISLSPEDSAADIEQKVRTAEPDFYIDTIRKILKKEIDLD